MRAATDQSQTVTVAWAKVPSPIGDVVVAASPDGVVLVDWDRDRALERLGRDLPGATLVEGGPLVAEAARQLTEYFAGTRAAFDLPIDWRLSRGFTLEVRRALAEVPFGETVTYGELARRVGRPTATRAVGSAMATNPVPIVVPCHRVLPAAGGLGNFSAPGGPTTKAWLLTHEGAR